jgi:hypothetical protein
MEPTLTPLAGCPKDGVHLCTTTRNRTVSSLINLMESTLTPLAGCPKDGVHLSGGEVGVGRFPTLSFSYLLKQ